MSIMYNTSHSSGSQLDQILEELTSLKRELQAINEEESQKQQKISKEEFEKAISALNDPLKDTSRNLKVPKEFKEYLEKYDIWEDWKKELQILNKWMTPDGKDKHAKFIQELLDIGDFKKALNESFLKSTSLKGSAFWDRKMVEIERAESNPIHQALQEVRADTSGSMSNNSLRSKFGLL